MEGIYAKDAWILDFKRKGKQMLICKLLKKRMKKLIVVSVLCVLVAACNSCAVDCKLSGPSISWRSGAGKEAANLIAEQPLGKHEIGLGHSAASNSPAKD